MKSPLKSSMPAAALACLLAQPLAADTGAALLDSIRGGHGDSALSLLAARPALAVYTEADGTSALHWAVHRGEAALVSALLEQGADPNARNDYGVTPLSEAAVRGEPAIIQALLAAGAAVEGAHPDGQTPLMVLARNGRVDSARLLLDAGADPNAREKWRGQTALMWAAAQCQPAMVSLLIEAGADPDARSTINEWERQVSNEPRAQWRPIGGLTPLLLAAREGCLGSVQALVRGGADLDLPDPEGMVPLFIATNNFHFDIAAWLLEQGANPNRWDWRGRTPLYAAVDLSTLPRGGRPDRPSQDATTALTLVSRLLEAGANPDIQLKLFPPYRYLKDDRGADEVLRRGATPLLRAAKAFDIEVMRLLLARGADPALANEDGITPLMAAAGHGSTPIDTRGQYDVPAVQTQAIAALRLLIDAGADIHAVDHKGQTALFGAAAWGWTEVAGFLIDQGVEPKALDHEGLSALDAARGKVSPGRGRGARELAGLANEDTARLIEAAMGPSPRE